MPYVKTGRLRQLEAAESELNRVRSMTPDQFFLYQRDRAIDHAIECMTQKMAEEFWMGDKAELLNFASTRLQVNA